MSVLDDFIEKFGRPRSAWSKEQWEEVAIALASRLDLAAPSRAKRGRPAHGSSALIVGKNGKITVSKKANYEALAWQVQQRMQDAEARGQPITMRAAVEEEMRLAIQRNNATPPEQRGEGFKPIGEFRVRSRAETAYTNVRKILSRASKNKKGEGEEKNAADI